MRVLFISGELIAGDLAYRLVKEGCDVKLFIADKSRKDCLDNMVPKTDDWKAELDWVGKDGLIVFDDIGYGKTQDDLRRKGFKVVGGSTGGDRLEKDRNFGQEIFSKYGIPSLETYNFSTIPEAIEFIKDNKRAWVLKQDGHIASITYVGVLDDGRDVLENLEGLKNSDMMKDINAITLQRKVDGIEIGVARYFNGNDWIGPIELNVEHKSFCNGDIGPQTGEMGTVMWYSEKNRLFDETLSKLKPFLQEINFKGDVDINCIINKQNVYPLEATTRFGCPASQLQDEIHISPWKEFLMAAAKGEPYDLEYKKGVGMIVSLSIPPFPYSVPYKEQYPNGAGIFFKRKLSEEELSHIHFEEVSIKKVGNVDKYHVAGSNGYIIYVSGFGKNIDKASKQAYELVNQIIIPKVMYRTDIGVDFARKGRKLLKKWGWI